MIGQSYIRVDSLADAVGNWEVFCDAHDLGASESPKVTCAIDGRFYRVSYNGRCRNAATGEEVTHLPGMLEAAASLVWYCTLRWNIIPPEAFLRHQPVYA
jgi:hypothetical protein